MKHSHDWIPSQLGHGELMCSRCFITNREAAVLGELENCRVPPLPPASVFETRYQGWTPPDLVLPDGLTQEQLDRATSLVFEWQASGEPYGTPLVLEILEVLRRGQLENPR